MARRINSVRPPIAQRVWYRKKLAALLTEIADSFTWWVGASYRKHEGEIVTDASPQTDIERRINKVLRDWRKKLNTIPDELAEAYVTRLDRHTTRSLSDSLAKSGFSITLKTSKELETVRKSLVNANVALINDLTDDYLNKAQGIVWRGVKDGRDLEYIKNELHKQAGIEIRRAARIAEDQANKATQALAEERAKAIGITKGIWQHNTSGSKTYRSTHIAFDGQEYDIEKGLYDDDVGEYVRPGELPFCKCSFRILIDEAQNG